MKRRNYTVPTTVLLPILQRRAEEMCTLNGHSMSVWQPAKKRFGKGALKTLCEMCGAQIVAMPYGEPGARINVVRDNPGLLGDALTKACVVDALPKVLGLR